MEKKFSEMTTKKMSKICIKLLCNQKKELEQKNLILQFFKSQKKKYTFYGMNSEECNSFVRKVENMMMVCGNLYNDFIIEQKNKLNGTETIIS